MSYRTFVFSVHEWYSQLEQFFWFRRQCKCGDSPLGLGYKVKSYKAVSRPHTSKPDQLLRDLYIILVIRAVGNWL